MKLFNFLIGSIAARKGVTYRDVLESHKEGKALNWQRNIHPNFLDHSNCPTLPADGNIDSWVCENENCVAVCKSNSAPMPNGSNTKGGSRLRCKKPKVKKGETEAYWNKDAPVCKTCDEDDINAEPEITDSNIDMLCDIGLKNMKECFLTCKNGAKLKGNNF